MAARRERGPSTGAWVLEILPGRLERFRHLQAEIDDRPTDDAVHQVRVAARRLQAALRLCGPFCEFPASVTLGPLRRVERRFGALRDLDVLAARLAAEPLPDAPAGAASLHRCRESLERERAAAGRKAATAVDRRRLTRLLDGLDEWLGSPRFSPVAGLDARLIIPDLLLPALGRVLLHPGWLTGDFVAPDLPASRPLHALRRSLKALRYAIECIADRPGEPVSGWLDELHAMQDGLGAWHDEGILRSRLEPLEGLEGLREAALTRARSALQPWPLWRDRYLDPGVRHAMRRMLEGPQEERAMRPLGERRALATLPENLRAASNRESPGAARSGPPA